MYTMRSNHVSLFDVYQLGRSTWGSSPNLTGAARISASTRMSLLRIQVLSVFMHVLRNSKILWREMHAHTVKNV
jgi:hypothetical protein